MVYSLPNNPLGYDDARLWKREYGYGLGKRMGADLPYLGEDYGLWPSVDHGAGKRNIGDDLPKSEDVEKRGEGYGYGLGKRWTNWGYKPNYITWSTLGKLGKRNKGNDFPNSEDNWGYGPYPYNIDQWPMEGYGYGLGKRSDSLGYEPYNLDQWPNLGKRNRGDGLPNSEDIEKRGEPWSTMFHGLGKRSKGYMARIQESMANSEKRAGDGVRWSKYFGNTEKRADGYGFGLGKRFQGAAGINMENSIKETGYREFAPQEYEKRNLIQLPEDDYQAYEPQVPAYQDPNQILFKRMNRKKELKNLYGRIAEKFPFLAKQGLKGDSLDDLFGMTIFGQPKAGK